jgi:hypothetical protein
MLSQAKSQIPRSLTVFENHDFVAKAPIKGLKVERTSALKVEFVCLGCRREEGAVAGKTIDESFVTTPDRKLVRENP